MGFQVGGDGDTTNANEISRVSKFAVPAWLAVIILVPTLTIVIVLILIVATLVLPLEYVKAPLLFEVGSVILNGWSPFILDGIMKLVIVGRVFPWKHLA